MAHLASNPKPDGVSPIRFGLHCNADGQLSAPDDVFDLAELCYGLSQDGWSGEQIAQELGWSETRVTRYSSIKSLLHSQAWSRARTELPRNSNLETDDEEVLGGSPTSGLSSSICPALMETERP